MAPALAGALAARGYETLTAVQTAVLAPEANGADLLVSAQTGSGKTVAFGLAIAPTLLGGAERFDGAGAPLAPGHRADPRTGAAGSARARMALRARPARASPPASAAWTCASERRALEQGAHIVVGTPGRLRDHITRGSLDISALRAVVLDEADEMLDLGFREDLEFILDAAPADRRTLLFSATVPHSHRATGQALPARRAAHRPRPAKASQHADIEYRAILVAPSERENAIINVLRFFDAQNTLVFCATREAVQAPASRLANRGFSVVSLSGELSQAERTNALQAMRDGRARVCVATDVAARGIDLPNLDLVIHADLPTNPETLLHRSGRTGRAGRKGICALIVPYHRRGSAARLLKLAKLEATVQPAPGPAEIDARNRERILADPALTEAPAEEEMEFVRELLSTHSPEQVAAAFLRQQLAARPAAEELSDGPAPKFDPAKGERPDTRFTDGVWFTISVGRKHRAEPRWLLPLICKAGHVTKREIGSIRILDTESRFEIVSDRADAFAKAVKEHGTGEKGVVIQPAGDAGAPERSSAQERAPEPTGSWEGKKKKHRKGATSHAPRAAHDGAPNDRPKKKFKPKKRPPQA